MYPSFPPPPHSANYIARSLLHPHRVGTVPYLQVVRQLFTTTRRFISSPPQLRYLPNQQQDPLPPLQLPLLRLLPQHPRPHRVTRSTRTTMRQATVAVISTSQVRQPRTTRLHIVHKGRPKWPHNTMLTSSTRHRDNNNILTLPGISTSLRRSPP